jgi:hypothetical protein
MKSSSRVFSILYSTFIDSPFSDIQTFDLSKLDVPDHLNIEMPKNLRLGHLAEKVVAGLIKASTNYHLIDENIQLIEDGTTIGELDFIIQNLKNKELIHLELAFKFYLYDPVLSTDSKKNWIGPNRNDSLVQKIQKLEQKQFPLLHHPCTSSSLQNINTKEVSQALCFLCSLYIPLDFKENLGPNFENAIKGYYFNFDTFKKLDAADKNYYIPQKKEWGIDPSENEQWASYATVEKVIVERLQEKRSSLIWQKQNDQYSSFFIVWW